MRDIGLNVEEQAVSPPQFYESRTSKKPVSEGGWSLFVTGFPPATWANPYFSPVLYSGNTQDNPDGWPGWPIDERIENLKEEFMMTPGFEERRAIATEIHREAMDHVTHVPFGYEEFRAGFSNKWTGEILTSWPVFWGIRPAE